MNKLNLLLFVLKVNLQQFIKSREPTIRTLKEIAAEMNCSKLHGNRAQIAGGVILIASSVVGAVAAPFTGGVSLGLTIASVVLGGGGIVTRIGASIGMKMAEERFAKKANSVLKEDNKKAKQLQRSMERLQLNPENLYRYGCKTVLFAGERSSNIVEVLTKFFPNVLISTKKAGSSVINVANIGSAVKLSGAAFGVMFIPLYVWDIVDGTEQLHEESEMARQLNKTIKELEQDLKDKKECFGLIDGFY